MDRRDQPGRQFAARGSGAIWTTIDDCVTTQDANHYAVGHVIVINTSDFDPGTYAWSIAGNPGGSSGDPGATVASGTLTIGSSGAATGVTGAIGGLRDPGSHQACFYAYRVRADDWGEYRFAVGGKNDNYRVDGLIDVAKTATVGWTRTYEWTIAKSVRPTRMDLFSGETAIFSYAVQLTRSTLSDAYGVTGTITANNTNTTLPALVDVVDCLQVSVAGVCSEPCSEGFSRLKVTSAPFAAPATAMVTTASTCALMLPAIRP